MRLPFEYVVIYRDKCTHTYGQGGCSAVIGQSGVEKCFNSIGTCQVARDFNRTEVKDYFVTDGNIVAPLQRMLSASRVYPFLDSVSHKPAVINPLGAKSSSGALGTRASIGMSFTDAGSDDSEQDPYYYQRLDGTARASLIPYKPNDYGSFFGKYFARNEYLWGRRVDWVVGYIENDTIVDTSTRTYVISGISEPDEGGRLSIQAQDVLSLTNAKSAKAPMVSIGKVDADYDELATSITLKPSGVGATYAASGVVKIGKELCKYTLSGDTMTLERGQFGSPVDEIKEDSTVQECLVIGMGVTPKLPPNMVVDKLLRDYTNIPPSLFDTAQWAAEVASKPWLQHEYEAIISTPTGIEKLLNDVAEQMLFFPFVDEYANKIKMRAIAAELSGELVTLDLNDREHIIADSFTQKREDAQAITRLYSYVGVINWAEKLDDIKNYSACLINAALDEESDDRRRYAKAKDITGYWLTPTLADINAGNTLQQFAKSPYSMTFSLDAKDRAINLANFVEIKHRLITDKYGFEVPVRAQINSIKEAQAGAVLDFTATSYEQYRVGSIDGNYVVPIPANTVNVNLRDLFSSTYQNVTLQTGDNVKFIQRAGVIISSVSTAQYALDSGVWPAGVTVEYECEGANYIVGKGGTGSAINRTGFVYSFVSATNGGVAINLRAPIVFSGALTIGGGGGGGGWTHLASGPVALIADYGGGGAGYGEGYGGIAGEGETGTLSSGGLNVTVFYNQGLFPDFVSGGRGGNLGENGVLANVGASDLNVLTGGNGLAGKAIIGYNHFTAGAGSNIVIKGAAVP